MSEFKHYLSWQEILSRLAEIYTQGQIYYGVPKGGMLATGFLPEGANITHDPEQASVILDDIEDSGKTRKLYESKYPHAQFIPLYDRSDFKNKWLVFPWEADHPAGEESVEDNIIRVLEYIGEDPEREGLQDTPKRVVKSWKELYAGYSQKPEDFLTVFESEGYDELVLLDNIEMYSMCEHHMLPFYGKAHVAYIPNGKIVGISKLARLVDMYSRRLQNQERITQQVAKAIMQYLQPKGAACIIEAKHMCMCSRGVGKQNSVMKTSSLKGAFFDKPEARAELMAMIG